MGKKVRTAITPTREDNFAEWYQQVIKAADMAETAPVRGCMTIKPYGFALWERMQRVFDDWLKEYDVQNCSFPLLIPLEFISREADHVEGFAKECAVVTHHRLEADPDGGGLRPAPSAALEEPYVVRPTSETIIGDSMSRWVQSYRDLPLKLNQWCNVMRWEMRTRLFLRTSEFFWHEGHNAFATKAEALADTDYILKLYDKFFREYLAIPCVMGLKTKDETFPGADDTYCIEAMMQDGKALQAATSHYLGQNFAKTFDIKFQTKDGGEDLAHTTSWAFTTRMIGALIMIHGDDDGMMMPPRIAPQQVVILPILRDDADTPAIMAHAQAALDALRAQGIRAKIDDRDMRTPDKMWDAVKKGVPLRIEIGAREAADGTLTHVRRDIGRDSKTTESLQSFADGAPRLLDDIHDAMLARASDFYDRHVVDAVDTAAVEALYEGGHLGFVRVDADLIGDADLEKVMETYKLSYRCKPLAEEGRTVLIARSY